MGAEPYEAGLAVALRPDDVRAAHVPWPASDDGTCSCCGMPFPCVTRRLADEVEQLRRRVGGTERRHDLEYMAAGVLTALLVGAQHLEVDDVRVPTDDAGVITGALNIRILGAWFKITPALLAMAGGVCRVCGCTDETACFGGCSWVAPDLCSACGDGPTEAGDG